MSDKVKIAFIIALGAIACVSLYIYFSPYNSCVRGLVSSGFEERGAHLTCSRQLGASAR